MSKWCPSKDEVASGSIIHKSLINGATKYGYFVESLVTPTILKSILGKWIIVSLKATLTVEQVEM